MLKLTNFGYKKEDVQAPNNNPVSQQLHNIRIESNKNISVSDPDLD
jgi:hypothetical protein